MPEPDFLANNGPSPSILQPHSVRSRSRFRGPRESHKMNLEAHQFYLDITKLLGVTDEVSEYNLLWGGFIYSASHPIETATPETATPPTPTSVDSLSDMSINWDGESGEVISDAIITIPDLTLRIDQLLEKLKYSTPVITRFNP